MAFITKGFEYKNKYLAAVVKHLSETVLGVRYAVFLASRRNTMDVYQTNSSGSRNVLGREIQETVPVFPKAGFPELCSSLVYKIRKM